MRDSMLGINSSNKLCGRIAWDDDLVEADFDYHFVIDGKRITIEYFVKLIRSYEGFHFKFSIIDPSDEVD